MRRLYFLVTAILLLIAPCYSYSSCDGKDSSKDLSKPGFVSLTLSEKICTDKEETQCSFNFSTDRDHCESPSVVIKYSCINDDSVGEKFNCPKGTTCKKGACAKK